MIVDLSEMVEGARIGVAGLEEAAKVVNSQRHAYEAAAKDLKKLADRRMDGFAVAYEDAGTPDGWAYIASCWNYGNLVRTTSVESAALWMTEQAVGQWIEDLRRPRGEGRDGKPWRAPIYDLAGKTLKVLRVRVVIEPTGSGFRIPPLPNAG